MPTFMQTDSYRLVSLVIMTLSALVIVSETVMIMRSVMKRKILAKQEAERVLGIVAFLYAFGVAAKVSMFGPSWLRWYVADIGFPVMWLLALTALLNLKTKAAYREAQTEVDYCVLNVIVTKTRFKLLALVTIGCVVYEIFAGYLVNRLKSRGGDAIAIGGFDWFDILCYVIGASIAATVLLHQRRIDEITLGWALHQEAVQADEARRGVEISRTRQAESRKAYSGRKKGKK